MNLDFSEAEKLIQQTAREFAQVELLPGAAARDRTHQFPEPQLKLLAQLGFLSMMVPESYGGSAIGPFGYALAVSEFAEACASTTVAMMVSNMVADAIVRFGDEKQKKKYLPHFHDGTYTCASFCLSEPDVGSDAAAIKTRARRDGHDYILNGQKAWVTSATHAAIYLVMAQLEESAEFTRPACFIIPRETTGVHVAKVEEKMGLRASSTAVVSFDDVRVSKDALLGGEGQGLKIAFTALDGGRIGVGAQALGIARAALNAALQYAKNRQAFGHPLCDFQAIQFKLANMATELEAAKLLVLRAARQREQKLACSHEAAMAKLFSSEAAYRTCVEAIQILGGYGYMGEYPVERYFRDVRVTMIYEGANEIQRLIIARQLLKG